MFFRSRLLIPILCFLLVPPLLAQGMTYGGTGSMTRDDQMSLVAPTSSGETGLFTVITADTLRRGDWSFGIYFNNWDLEAAREPSSLTIPSARENGAMSYDLYRLSASVGYGLTDNWEITASLPWDRLKNNGNDRAGFINGFFYSGRFSDSGLGDLHLATKFRFGAGAPNSRFALSLFTDLPTGDSDSGISTGNASFGVGGHWTGGPATVGASYRIRGDRDADDSNFPSITPVDVELPNEFRIEGGLNWPLSFWSTTNWVSEAQGIFYTGGDFKPRSPVFLSTGIRHWFGDSGWALSAGARWNVAKFGRNNDECRFTELDDCGLSGLVGLTFAPLHLAAVAPPPPAPVAPPPPPPAPTPAPVAPPEPPPVTPPKAPTEIRTDEIHFEPGSARLTNIAKAILDDVALRMKQEPAATAIVIGYTDDREATGPNADLDRRRAEAVRDYLVTRHGIDPARITVEGRGSREPVGDNNTAEGRLRNRRVVIRLMLP